MNWRKFIRVFSLWVLPFILSILMIVAGFIWWCFANQAGTRWLLQTATAQVQGHAFGVRGTLLKGVYVEGLDINLEQIQARAVGLHLKLKWLDLIHNKRLHINDLSVVRLDLALQSEEQVATDESSVSTEFAMPQIPIGIQIDRLALNGLGLLIDGEPLPIEVLSVLTAASLDADSAAVRLDNLHLAKDTSLFQLSGNLLLHGLMAPWPFELNLQASAQDNSQDSLFCTNQWLAAEPTTEFDDCRIQADAKLAGSIDNINLDINGSAQNFDFKARADVLPKHAFPLAQAQVDFKMVDGSGFDLSVQPTSQIKQDVRPIKIDLNAQNLGLNRWLPPVIKNTKLNLTAQINTAIDKDFNILNVGTKVNLLEDNFWNGQALQGHINLAQLSNGSGALVKNNKLSAYDKYKISGLDIDLRLADSKVYIAGNLAANDSKLGLNIDLPKLSSLWPEVAGGANLQAVVFGSIASLNGGLKAAYIFDKVDAKGPLAEPINVQSTFSGGFDDTNAWHGQLADLNLTHGDIGLKGTNKISFDYDPAAGWQVGQANLRIELQDQELVLINHINSSGNGKNWHTKGVIPSLIIDSKRLSQLQDWFASNSKLKGSVKVDKKYTEQQLELGLQWDLDFVDALSGKISLQRKSGDLTIPSEIPVNLELKAASLEVNFNKINTNTSKILADVQMQTHKMGSLRVRADTLLHATDTGSLSLNDADSKNIHLEAESEDLAWLNLFLGGAQELGGKVTADIKASSLPNGKWNLTGPIIGESLSFVIPDQGIRLLDGELSANFTGMHLGIDKLYFPASQRVTPKESRTAEWLASKDAKDGYLNITGDVDLENQTGEVNVALQRYPVLQRADRYAMISGDLNLAAHLPELNIKGKLIVDAGWLDIDMLSDIPELSSDVLIIKRGETLPEPEPALINMQADISIDMGDKFYITGFGLDSGLVGSMDIHLADGKLKAMGALRTRGGSIKAYGQNLSLRRGRVTFQGDITNPVLDIEALRTGESVQAGVAVVGSARKPKINLVSYPEVSETEKLSWLLLGHGPDESGSGDMTLLFSVGSSFLADGEPFYKKFGLDELSMRSGELGSTGSLLPVESVVSGINSNSNLAEQRFLMASKNVSSKLQVSLEQALAQTGTVARLSYKLMWRLRSEITVGTTNGLAIVYRWFSKD